MDNSGAKRIAAFRKLQPASKKGVHQSARGVAGAGMNSHARRLVDGDDVFVFVEDFQRDEFGFRGDGGPFRDFNGNFFAAAKMHGAFPGRLAVYADLAGVDQFPHTRST